MSELIEEAHAKRPRVAAGSGTGARLQAAAPVHARYGLRGSRASEASNPGPSFVRLRRGRSATVNIGTDTAQFSALSVDDADPVGLQTAQVDGDTMVSRASSRRFTVEDSDTESLEFDPQTCR